MCKKKSWTLKYYKILHDKAIQSNLPMEFEQ